jgi:hypothetical protein
MPRYSARFLAAPRPTLYARRTKGGGVDMFLDKEATELTSWYSLGDPKRPRHGRKWFTLRNFRYKLEWLPDLDSVTGPTAPTSTGAPANADQKR